MEVMTGYLRKSSVLNQETLKPIVNNLQKAMHSTLLTETDPRTLAPGTLRSAVLELSYILVRHRQWHYSDLLSELAIDFLSSEYLLPGSLCTAVVEAALDVLHAYTPRELDWTPDTYDDEFLEHLIVCSLISADEDSLAIDLGFGRNAMALLKNALALQAEDDVFQFAPEVTMKLHERMQHIFQDLEDEPQRMDDYRLKNTLQRDPAVHKQRLAREGLTRLSKLLSVCFPKGKSLRELEAMDFGENLTSDLRLLTRNGLLFEEPARKPHGSLFQLSHQGHELTALRFGYANWDEVGAEWSLRELPSPYQASALQLLAQNLPDQLTALLRKEGAHLSPLALRYIIEQFKRSGAEIGLLAIFEEWLQDAAHPWIRAEICRALPFAEGKGLKGDTLEHLLNDDPSPMVRNEARLLLQRQRSARMPSDATAEE